MPRSLRLFLGPLVLSVILQLGCGGGAGATSPAPEPPPTPTPKGVLATSTSSIPFGSVDTNSSKTQPLTLSNTGDAALSVSAVAVPASAFSATSPSVPFNIAPGASVTVNVTFAPTAAGAASASLSITSSVGNATVALSGTGVAPATEPPPPAGSPAVSVNPSSLDFGIIDIDASGTLSFDILNTGTAELSVNAVSSDSNLYNVAPLTTPIKIAAGTKQTVEVTYTPTSENLQSGSISLSTNAGTTAVTVKGKGRNKVQPLSIGGVTSSSITTNSAIVSWTTNNASTSQIEYGTSTSYGQTTTLDSTMATSHQQQLTGLAEGATYHFRVRSQDANNSSAVSGDFTFTTTSNSNLSCAATNVRCVGTGQEYASITSASSAAVAGDTILVMDGTYPAFQITKSGTSSAQLTYKANSSNVVISGSGPTGDGVYLARVSYVTVDGFKITNPSGRCISAREASATSPVNGLKILNNTCINSGTEGFYLSQVANSLVQANTITGTGSTGAGRSHGIYLANAGSKNTTLKGNVITGMTNAESAGIHMNGDISVGGDGLITGVVLDGNMIFGGSFNGISADGVQNSTFQNNLIYNMGRNGIRAFQIDGAAGPKNLRIVNNTIVLTTSGWAVKISEDGGGHVIFNNILLGPSNGGALSVGNATFSSDRNAVSDDMSMNNESTVLTLAQWKAQGKDANSFVSTSSTLFVNASGGDYHLKTGSPAVDKGAANFGGVNAPGQDINGNARPNGTANDLGAYE